MAPLYPLATARANPRDQVSQSSGNGEGLEHARHSTAPGLAARKLGFLRLERNYGIDGSASIIENSCRNITISPTIMTTSPTAMIFKPVGETSLGSLQIGA
ncbi:hypothetical protein I41_37710 [Lacipirellula limnantheis]|uniref:Uncharacterized protein n=1 Tax=Lacipirellula limnantheis TaxID=2528024 RepID=A0A517U1R7_9BACT|nr:hypothetical protein I41_37710 [Lacipirellula limnantheis]